MSSSHHFSVTTAGAFVVGGVAALVLATVIALGGYGRSRAAEHGGSSRAIQPKGSGSADSAPEARGEYLLDVSEVTEASKLP